MYCKEGLCKNTALYGNNYALYCKAHKEDNMEIKPRKCVSCSDIATHGKEYIKYCCEHAPIKVRFLITCIVCKARKAKYCVPLSNEPTHCFEHKNKLMQVFQNNIGNDLCVICNEAALYGNFFSKKTHCEAHKLSHQHKSIDALETLKLSKIYALICIIATLGCAQKPCTKENRVKQLLIDNKINFIHNRTAQNSSRKSKYRPDFVIEKESFNIIVEVDEHQHKNYCKIKEVERMEQIYNDFGCKNTIFLRYNPDHCIKNTPIKIREEILINTIKTITDCSAHGNNSSNKFTVHYLFYD